MEGLQVLQGLPGRGSEAGLGAGCVPANMSLEVWVQQRWAQEEHNVLVQQHWLQETKAVVAHLPVSIWGKDLKVFF